MLKSGRESLPTSTRKSRKNVLRAAAFAALPAAAFAFANHAQAQTYYYQGNGTGPATGGSGEWNQVIANWTTDPTGNSGYQALPAFDPINFVFTFGDLNFGSAGGLVQVNDLVDFQSMNFTGNYVITNAGVGATNTTLSMGVGDGSHTAGLINVSAGNTVRIIPSLQGTGTLFKDGAGTLILNGFGGFTGSVNVNAGILAFTDNQGGLPTKNEDIYINTGATLDYGFGGNVVSENGAPGIGDISGGGTFHLGSFNGALGATNGSRMIFNGTNNLSWSGQITGEGVIAKIGGSTWNMGGTSTYTGLFDLGGPAGTNGVISGIVIQSDTALSKNAIFSLANNGTNGGQIILNVNNHSVTMGQLNSPTVSGTNSSIILGNSGTGGTITFGNLNNTAIFEENITGLGNMVKVGTGVDYWINNTNNFTGRVYIQGGALTVSNDNKLGAVPSSFTAQQINLDGGALGVGNAAITLSTNRGVFVTGNNGTVWTSFNITYNHAIDGTGQLTKTGEASWITNASQTYSGGTRIIDGTWQNTVQNGNPVGTGSLYMSGSTMTLSPGGTTTGALAIAPNAGGQFTYGPGSILNVNQNSNSGNVTVTVGNAGDSASPFVRDTNGTLVISSGSNGIAALGTAGGVQIIAANGNVPVNNGIVDPGIIGTTTSANSAGEFLTYGAGGFAQGAYSANIDINAATSSDVFQGLAGGTTTISTSASVYALNARNQTFSGGGLTVGDGVHTASVLLDGGAINTSSLALNGPGVIYTSTNNGTIGAPITGSGGLVKTGAGTLTLNGQSSYSGSTILTAGSTTLGVSNALPTTTSLVMMNGATLNVTNLNQTVGSLSGSNRNTTIALGASGAFTVGAGDSTYFGKITGTTTSTNGGTATLIKDGSGTLTLGYTGSAPDNIGDVTNSYNKLIVRNGGNVSLSGFSELTQVAGASAANIITDAITLDNGTLTFTSLGTDADNGNLVSSNTGGANRNIVLGAGGGTIKVTQGQEQISFGTTERIDGTTNTALVAASLISGSGRLTIDGKGTFRSYGTNTYTGGTTLKGGVYAAFTATAAGDNVFGATPTTFDPTNITFDGGTFANSAVGFMQLSTNRGIVVTANGGTIENFNGNFMEIDGPISGPGVLTSIGLSTPGLILTNSSNSMGGLNVFNNWVIVGNSNVFGTGTVTINPISTYVFMRMDAGGTFTENNSWALLGSSIDSFRVGNGNGTNSTLILNGAVSGTADLTKDSGTGVSAPSATQGYGNLVLAGNNTYTGNTIVKTGMIVAANNNALGATSAGTAVYDGAAIGFQGNISIGAEPLAVGGTGVAAGSNGANGAIQNIAGTNSFAGAVSLIDATTALVSDNSSLALNGAISGAFPLTINGNSTNGTTFILGGNNANMRGGLTANNLTVLGIGHSNALGAATSSVTLTNVGTLLGVANATVPQALSIGNAQVDANTGTTLAFANTLTNTGDLIKGTNAGTVQIAQTGGYNANNNVTVNGGTLAFGDSVNGITGPVNIPGTLSVANGAAASFLPTTGVAQSHSINALNLNSSGKLDVGNSSFTTTTSTSTIQSYLANGYNNGAWNGSSGARITSISANTASGTAARSLGFASSADQAAGRVSNTVPTIASGSTLVKYTTPGDADLSGVSNFNDFLAMQNNFNKAGNWTQGDFDYNGTTNFNDFLILQNNFNRGLNANGTTAGGTVAHSAVSKLTASPAAVTPSVTYILSKNDDGKGNLTPGKYAVYAVDSSADGNQGVASFSVDVQGASLVTNFAPQGTFDKGQGNGSTVVEGFTLLRSVSGAFSTGTDPVKGSQDTVDDQSGVVLIYGMGQVAGNLNTKAPSGSTGGSAKVQASYGSPLLISTGTFASGLAFNSDQTFDKANVFLTNTAADTEAAGISLVTQDLSVGVPEPTTLGVIALGAGSLLARRKRRK